MEKKVKISLKEARELYHINAKYRDTILSKFTDSQLGISKDYTLENIGRISGYYIDSGSIINPMPSCDYHNANINVSPSREDCLSYLAECQLRQIAKKYNDNRLEKEWIKWGSNAQFKHKAYYSNITKKIEISFDITANNKQIYFKREKDLLECIKNNEALWLQYFKIK